MSYQWLVDSLCLCADSIDPIAECCFADCMVSAEQTGEFNPCCQADLMQKAAAAIESKPRWISVEEQLPGECIPVLVCFDFKGRKSVDVAELWSDGGFHNYSDEYLTPEGRKHRKGTHWMPLPEPPAEEQ